MNIEPSPSDALTVGVLLVAYFKAKRVEAESKKREGQWAEAQKMEADIQRISLPQEKAKAISALNEYKAFLAAQDFSPWIGSRSFAVSLAFSLISLCIGLGTIPGLLLGLVISSPRIHGAFIMGPAILFRTN